MMTVTEIDKLRSELDKKYPDLYFILILKKLMSQEEFNFFVEILKRYVKL